MTDRADSDFSFGYSENKKKSFEIAYEAFHMNVEIPSILNFFFILIFPVRPYAYY